jgi:hypothetical protein
MSFERKEVRTVTIEGNVSDFALEVGRSEDYPGYIDFSIDGDEPWTLTLSDLEDFIAILTAAKEEFGGF